MDHQHQHPYDLTEYYKGNSGRKPAYNLTEYYENTQLYNPSEHERNSHEKRSLFGIYLFGIITAVVILSGAIALVTLSPHQQREIITERVITVTSAANITPQSPAHRAVPTRVHKIPSKPATTKHANKPTTSTINTPPPAPITTHANNCPPNVNAKDNQFGITELQLAAANGNLDQVRLLLNCGANVNAKDNDGDTPLHYAALNDKVDVARVLLDHGANVNAKTNNLTTPLRWAAAKASVDMARLLLDHGADVNAKTDFGMTPLFDAAHNGKEDMMALLRSRGGHE